ncbi:MAG: hypothetical protein CML29_15270 [Rhizobiales bacterium]|nr:hypothetical protein [Hyphomicrobiales bacterium]MBA69139.1 hypothetical protein [Hyphomicrobiales bacterium]|tara:strand:- start:2261 stop:3337 length:1077 start_codon:yes stop_codon:yes gene_type:complete
MKTMTMDRRRLLQFATALGATALLPRSAFADIISEATITGSAETTTGVAKSGKLRIGFSNGFSGNTWRTMALAQMKNEAAANADAYELIIVDGQGDVAKQVGDLDDLIAQQVDAILVIPNSGTAVVPALRKAERQGIMTVPFNLPVEGDTYSAFTGTDPKAKGAILGARLNDMLGGKGKIVAFGGLPGNSYSAGVWEGAISVFAPGIEVLAQKDGYWEEDRAKIIMADLLAAYPQIDGIFSDGGQMAAGAVKAMLDAGRELVPVTGDDYNGLLKLYESNKDDHPKFNIALVSEPSWEGVVAIRIAQRLLAGETVPKMQIISPTEINADNYKDYIKPDLPDGVFVDTTLTDDELKAMFS